MLALALVSVLARAPSAAAADPCGPPVVNPVACENSKTGDPPSDWQVDGVGDTSIQGYATSMSVNVGQTVTFKIKTPSTSYHIDILRLGYYGGKGARKIASGIRPSATLPQTQPACLTNSSTGLIDCGNWSASASWTVPSDAVSGIYIAHLVRDDPQNRGADSQIPFVVRDDSSHSQILVQASDETWEAYNAYGGNSLYSCSVACPPGTPGGYKAAYAVSYNRPFDGSFQIDNGSSYLYYAEYQMIRWLEKNGYDLSYIASSDVDRSGSLLLNHKAFVASGHDEYWSGPQRASVTAARDAGVNLAFFTGNEMYWKTRFAPSGDGANTPYRTLISYKETHFDSPVDPLGPSMWTGTWADPRFSPPGDGGNPSNSLTGQMFLVNSGTADITVPYQYSKLRIWRNTDAARLSSGQSLTLGAGTGTLGYEWDVDADNGFRPPGLLDLSSTTVSGVQPFIDYGTTTVNGGTATHHLTLYRASSGALVFGAGTVQWAWGLDNTNAWNGSITDPSGNPPDPNMEQATVNLLGDMGAQPATLRAGLVSANASTDTTAPTSSISSPASAANLNDGDQVTISGSASDSGGVVAGVEVSTDGGSTWHPATLSGPAGPNVNWSYKWVAHGSPSTTIKTRAVDDSGNLQQPTSSVTVNVACPCSIWGVNVTPSTIDSGDPTSGTLGVKFKSDTFGTITGVRFYKAATNTGTHVGAVWSASGQLLAQATFTSETASGWQTVTFSNPVTVFPGTTYVAGYFDPKGHYSATSGYFYAAPSPPPVGGGDYDSPPLHALPNGTSANGVYSVGTSLAFPANTFGSSNYWVDPVFTPMPAPGKVTGVSAEAGYHAAVVSWSAPSSGGTPTTYTVTPYIGSVAQTTTTVSGSPLATNVTVTGLQEGTTYTFKVQASNPNGSGPNSDPSNAVTVTGPAPPFPPTGTTASPANGQALVSWTPPTNNNGSAITGYRITPYVGSTAQTPTLVNDGSATSATVKNLNNDTPYTFTVAAINSLGTGQESAPSSTVTPENTILDFAAPRLIDGNDSGSGELGVKFMSDTSGSVTGIRFYKAAANTGTHTGSLWTATGTKLASATFTNETASGWQTVLFSTPVQINANTIYVASYFDPNGHYSATPAALESPIDSPPLHAVATSISANGVYAYSQTSTFPTNTYNANNYSVDVLFRPTPPGQVTNVTATADHLAANVSWSPPASGGATKYIVTPYIGSTAQTPTTITGSPLATTAKIGGLTAGTAYTFKVQAASAYGTGPASAASNSVTPTPPAVPAAPTGVTANVATGQAVVKWTAPDDNGSAISSYKVTPYLGGTAQTSLTVSDGSATSATVKGLTNGSAYTFTVSATNALGTGPESAASSSVTPAYTIFDFTPPSIIDGGDPGSNELGVKFTSDTSGMVTGIRFYKAAANTGTHIGSLWTLTGTRLASATFTNETASGWQTVVFSSPVPINANTIYVASYFDPSGHYSATPGGLNTAVDNPPLHAVSNNTSANGLYAYTGTSIFPANTYNANSYSVDVLFQPTPPGQVTNVSATASLLSARVSWSAPASGGATKYIVTPYIGSTAQTPTTVTGSPPATSTTIDGLTAGTAYTFTVKAANAYGTGAESAASNSITPNPPSAPTAPTGVIARPASNRALVSWTAPSSNNGSAITSYTITPYIGSTAQTPTQVNDGSATSATVSSLSNGTAYTFTVSATNGIGTSPESAASSAVTPANTIFDFTAPTIVDSDDSGSNELGVKFTSDVSGVVTGIRFYKAAANTGTHIGTLWTGSGTKLASATFTSETPSGWQTVLFATPVPIDANAVYVASYFDPNGHYSATPAGLNSAVDNPPLHALATSTSSNGLYVYSATSTFPTNTYNGNNYSVDVLFAPSP